MSFTPLKKQKNSPQGEMPPQLLYVSPVQGQELARLWTGWGLTLLLALLLTQELEH